VGIGVTTRSGRTSRLPGYLHENFEISNSGADDYQIVLTAAEKTYYAAMATMEYGLSCTDRDCVETAIVGAGVGDGFKNTNELHTMTYQEAMASKEQPLWIRAIEEESRTLKEYGVFEPIEAHKIPQESKVLSTTWVMKKRPAVVTKPVSQHVASNRSMENTTTPLISRLQS
jgi:hypothetical protein